MGVCIYPKLPCSHCSSSDGVQRFEQEDGSVNATCMSCGHYYDVPATAELEGNDVVYDNSKRSEYSQQIFEEAKGCPYSQDYRGVKAVYWKYLGVRMGVSPEDGTTPITQLYPYEEDGELKGFKVRNIIEKSFWAYGTTKSCDMFGWRQAMQSGSPRLYITEGEVDCASLIQVINRAEKDKVKYKPAVVSCRQGVKSMLKDIQRKLPEILQNFKEVVIVPDNDSAGTQDLHRVNQLFPDDRKPKFASLRGKDPNQMLQDGQEDLLYADVRWNATPMLSGSIKTFSDEDFEHIKEPPEFGISYPWKGLTELLRGLRPACSIYIGAPEKSGKSTLVNLLAAHLMKEHNEPVFCVKPEEDEIGTLRRMAGTLTNTIMYDPKKKFDISKVDEAKSILKNKLYVLERSQTPSWIEVRQLIREAALVRGVKYFFIDPITNFSTGMSSSERDSFLHQMCREVAEDCKSLGITTFLFCHLKTVREGTPWEKGRVAVADDFAGSRAMVQSCDIAIALQAWMLTESDEGDDIDFLNRRRVLHVLREREYNAVGKVNLLWNPVSGKLEEQ